MENEQSKEMGQFEEITNIIPEKEDETIVDENKLSKEQNKENNNLNRDENKNFISKSNLNSEVNSDFKKNYSNKSAAKTILEGEKEKYENKNGFNNKSKSQEINDEKIGNNILLNIKNDNDEDKNYNNNCKITNNHINVNINKREEIKDKNNRYSIEDSKKDNENELFLKNNKNNIEENNQINYLEKENTIQLNQMKKSFNDYFVDDPEIKIMRLSDMDNNSYLNSVLRCLLNIEELKYYFLDEDETKIIYNKIYEKRLSFAIHRLFVHVYTDQINQIYELDKIKNVLEEKSPYFKQNSEMNPNICLNFILYQLDYELNLKKDNNSFLKVNQYSEKEVIDTGRKNCIQNNDSIISKTFSWHELNKAHCKNCKQIKYKFQSYTTFDLDIHNFYKERRRNRISIYDCLEFFISKKTKSKVYCDSCEAFIEVENSKSIIGVPKNLIFIIDRGDFDEKLMNINFLLDSEIDIQAYCEEIQTYTKYELNGIVSIFNEKYISLVKNDEDSWLLFDDSKIQMIENNFALNENDNSNIKHIPCILFYKLLNNQ